MSFWDTSPGPHWSDCIWSYLSCSGIPQAFPIRKIHLEKPKPNPKLGDVFLATEENAEEISCFLQEHFQITEKSKCTITKEQIKEGFEKDWIFLFTRSPTTREIVGTICSRPLGTCTFQFKSRGELRRSKCRNIGYIDFFCVRTDVQKTGLGSMLLRWIDYYTSISNRFIHFFQKEIHPLTSLPPLWQGRYIAREVMGGHKNPDIKPVHPRKLPAQMDTPFSISFQSEQSTPFTHVYKYDCKDFNIYAVITNTFHSASTGGPLGELLFYRIELLDTSSYPTMRTIAACLEEIFESSDYKYILMDESIPHQTIRGWKQDAPYFLYCYNVNPRHFFTCRPEFFF